MVETIWKFWLSLTEPNVLAMPVGAEVLAIQAQHGQPTLWAKVDPEQPREVRKFEVRGTGHDASGLGRHLGSFQLLGGDLVFHVFEGGAS